MRRSAVFAVLVATNIASFGQVLRGCRNIVLRRLVLLALDLVRYPLGRFSNTTAMLVAGASRPEFKARSLAAFLRSAHVFVLISNDV